MEVLTLAELLTALFESASVAEIKEYAEAVGMSPEKFLDHLDSLAE